MVPQPFTVLQHLRQFTSHIFPQSSQNLAVNRPIESLTRWNNLLMHISWKVKKMISMELVLLRTCRVSFWWPRGWRLPLRRLLLCFRIINIQPRFIFSFDTGHEFKIMSSSFLQLGAHLKPTVSMVIVQEASNKF